jgi:hypothetical protein
VLERSRTFFIFILVVAIAAVLFTPDPGDDIQGVLHQHPWSSGIVLLGWLLHRFSAGAPPALRLIAAPALDPSSRLDLVCIRLC